MTNVGKTSAHIQKSKLTRTNVGKQPAHIRGQKVFHNQLLDECGQVGLILSPLVLLDV
jgi:hypothetical protein